MPRMLFAGKVMENVEWVVWRIGKIDHLWCIDFFANRCLAAMVSIDLPLLLVPLKSLHF